MANSPISGLPAASTITGADLFVLEQNGTAKRLSGGQLASFIDRYVMDVTVHDLDAGATPTAVYDRITGALELGIPKGNSIVSITEDNSGHVVYTWADGSTAVCELIRGETGMSAFQYAQSAGYEGSETDFAQLQLDLYQASLNEQERVQAEQTRQSDYTYMMNRLNTKLNDLDTMAEQAGMGFRFVAGTNPNSGTLHIDLNTPYVSNTTLRLEV